jgi:hypothetical protein
LPVAYAPWMRAFRPSFDVFTGNALVACECGWTWDAMDGADTLFDAVAVCERHFVETHEEGGS